MLLGGQVQGMNRVIGQIICALKFRVQRIVHTHIGAADLHVQQAYDAAAEAETVGGIFPTCENISIDYAVMEKADYIYTLPASFEWSDVGTWGSLRTLLARDENGNAVIGSNIHLYNCSGCIVHAPQAKSLVLEGLTDSIVVEREGRLLICRLSQEQKIKDFHKD